RRRAGAAHRVRARRVPAGPPRARPRDLRSRRPRQRMADLRRAARAGRPHRRRHHRAAPDLTGAREATSMVEISDEYMGEMLAKTQPYTVVLLMDGPHRDAPDRAAIVHEHGRRNFALRAEGL